MSSGYGGASPLPSKKRHGGLSLLRMESEPGTAQQAKGAWDEEERLA